MCGASLKIIRMLSCFTISLWGIDLESCSKVVNFVLPRQMVAAAAQGSHDISRGRAFLQPFDQPHVTDHPPLRASELHRCATFRAFHCHSYLARILGNKI